MSNILVTAIGSFSAEVVINNLHASGHKIIATDIYKREWVANSLLADVFYQCPYATKEEEYISFLLKVCEEENVEYIMPLTDVEVDVISKNREKFSDYIVCLPKTEVLNICRNKYKLYEFLLDNGVDCLIPTNKVDNNISDWNHFPAVIKPAGGRSSEGLYFVKDNQELQSHVQNKSLVDYIIQPKIEGKVITVDVLRNEDFFMAIPRIELLRTINGAGTTVNVFNDEKLISIVKKIADVLGIKGCVNFEFIVMDNGDYRFLECNPRFSAGVAFSCLAGYDFINNHYNCYSNLPLEAGKEIKEMIISRKYQEFVMSVEEN